MHLGRMFSCIGSPMQQLLRCIWGCRLPGRGPGLDAPCCTLSFALASSVVIFLVPRGIRTILIPAVTWLQRFVRCRAAWLSPGLLPLLHDIRLRASAVCLRSARAGIICTQAFLTSTTCARLEMVLCMLRVMLLLLLSGWEPMSRMMRELIPT